MSESPISIALIGAGVFMQDAHVPALLAMPDRFVVKAVYSRTQASAAALANLFPYPVDVTTDLAAVLRRDDIEAVDIALPISLMPDAVRQALAAGKHVISEKPIAPTLAAGKQLVEDAARYTAQTWLIAENCRYDAAYLDAGGMIAAGKIGRLMQGYWSPCFHINEQNKYFHTTWRRTPDFQGGYLMDAGVHHAAIFRLVFGEIVEVHAFMRQNSPSLPPADTMSATLVSESGALIGYHPCYATSAPWKTPLHVVGSTGGIQIDREAIEINIGSSTETIQIGGTRQDGITAEFRDFADCVRTGKASVLGAPRQALQDVAIVEALLASAQTGKTTLVERV
jgi:predicted dehydrogenase